MSVRDYRDDADHAVGNGRRGEGRAARTVLIIDSRVLFGASLRMALAGAGLVAEQLTTFDRIPHILAQAEAVAPDLILVDLRFGYTDDGRRIDGVELVGPLRARGAAVVAFTDGAPLPRIAAAIAAGAAGVVSKYSSLEALLDVIAAVTAGEAVMSVPVQQELLALHRAHQQRERRFTQRLERLSPREREVLDLLARGQRIASIAERFVVSPNTVRSQIRGILVKLDVNSQLEAAALVREQPAVREALSADRPGGRPPRCGHCGTTSTQHWPWCPHQTSSAGSRPTVRGAPNRTPVPPPGAPATRLPPVVAATAQCPPPRSPGTAGTVSPPRRPAAAAAGRG